jgi:hypothetical protein
MRPHRVLDATPHEHLGEREPGPRHAKSCGGFSVELTPIWLAGADHRSRAASLAGTAVSQFSDKACLAKHDPNPITAGAMLTQDLLFGMNILTLAGFAVMGLSLTLRRMAAAGGSWYASALCVRG